MRAERHGIVKYARDVVRIAGFCGPESYNFIVYRVFEG
jgi:hypothetical protein